MGESGSREVPLLFVDTSRRGPSFGLSAPGSPADEDEEMLTPRRKSAQLKPEALRLGQAQKESVCGKVVRKSAEHQKAKVAQLLPQKKPLAAANREPLPRADDNWRVAEPQASVQEDPYGGSLPPGGIPTPTSSPQPLHPWARDRQQQQRPGVDAAELPIPQTPEELLLTDEQRAISAASRAAAEARRLQRQQEAQAAVPQPQQSEGPAQPSPAAAVPDSEERKDNEALSELIRVARQVAPSLPQHRGDRSPAASGNSSRVGSRRPSRGPPAGPAPFARTRRAASVPAQADAADLEAAAMPGRVRQPKEPRLGDSPKGSEQF